MTEFYTRQDVANMLGVSLPKVTEIFNRPDFPALKLGKSYKVEAEAFKKWCQQRRTNSDFERK